MHINFHRCLKWARIGAAMIALTVAASPAKAEEFDRLLGVMQEVHDTQPPLRYGVTLVHLQDDYWKGIAYGIVDEVKRVGGKVVQVDIAGKYGNVTQQFAQIQAMMAKGIDVLVLGASAYDGFDPVLKMAKAKGIKIIAVGTPVNSSLPDFGIVFSDFEIGKTLGKVLCDHKPQADFSILGLPGPAGAEWTRLRVEGLKVAVKDCPGAKLELAPVGGEISIGYGLSATADMITKYPDASFVWTPTMGLGMGAIQAVKQRHAKMQVVGSTLLRGIFPDLEDGSLLAVNAEPPILVGRMVVQYSIRQKLGMPTPLISADPDFKYPMIIAKTEILTKDNYKTYPWEQTDVPPADWSIDAFQ
jgi:ribose transport system substrate-binding protein